MDVSQRVAEALDFKNNGTARVKVEYVSKAALGGSDDRKLLATLRQDGGPAQLDSTGFAAPTLIASAPVRPAPVNVALAKVSSPNADDAPDQVLAETQVAKSSPVVQASRQLPQLSNAPLPPSRPFDLGTIPGAGVPIAAAKPPIRLGQVSYYVSTPISLSDHFEKRGPFEGLKQTNLHSLRSVSTDAQ